MDRKDGHLNWKNVNFYDLSHHFRDFGFLSKANTHLFTVKLSSRLKKHRLRAKIFEISSTVTDRMSANDRKSISLKVFDFKGPSKKLQGEFS